MRLGPGPEFDLIRRFVAGAAPAPPGVRWGPGDDVAWLAEPDVVVSTDLAVEDVHFRRAWLTPEEIGQRAAAAALSDLAAVAAEVRGVLLSLAVPDADVPDAAVALVGGARAMVEALGGALLGGDVTRSPGPLVVDVVAVGVTAAPVGRGGGRPGDEVWVTGWLGGAAGAVACWAQGQAPPPRLRARFARPQPRVQEALWLRARVPLRAAIDLSDGLVGDAAHVAAASEVALVLDPEAVPIDPAVRAALPSHAWELAVTGGEDYELLLLAPPGTVASHRAAFEATFGLPLTRLGTAEAGAGVWWSEGADRRPATERSFQHFASRPPPPV